MIWKIEVIKVLKTITDNESLIINMSLLNQLTIQIDTNGIKWYKAKEIAIILKYKNTKQAIRVHVHMDDKITYEEINIKHDKQIDKQTVFITKNGIRQLLIKSRQPNAIELGKELGIKNLKKYKCTIKEAEIVDAIKEYFDGMNIAYERQVEVKIDGKKYRLDIFVPSHKLVLEIDELGHSDRDPEYEKQREDAITKKMKYKLLRFNPDNFNNNGDMLRNIVKFVTEINKYIMFKL